MKWDRRSIRKLRNALGLSQWEFARKLGYKTYYAVYEWEAGRRKPSKQAQKLLDVVARNVRDFV